MNWIHHVADAAYVDNTDCGLTDFGNFTWVINYQLKTNKRLAERNWYLSHQISNAELQIKMFQISNSVKPNLSFDDKTNKLLKLALNNTNESEAKNAALQACRRIAEQIK